jgi:acyl-coenzyme A thioesterase PaaI-like protein
MPISFVFKHKTMKKLINPWVNRKGYRCFGCDPNHEHGLRMTFYEDGEDIVSHWTPNNDSQGWIDTLHGGIQATLCDEIAGWVVFRKMRTSGMTSRLDVRYHKPVSTKEGPVSLRARLRQQRMSMAYIDVELRNAAGELCTEALCVYYMFPQDQAKAQFGYEECMVEGEE